MVLPAGIARAASPPDSLTILGPGMSAPITIPSDTQADLYANLLRQVGWMVGRTGDYTKPDLKTVGPKYTIMVFAAGIATQVYDVYPEAAGGPRAFRPGRQPSGKNGTDAWFYATVTLPSVLRDAGVNLPEPVVSGQAAGSGYDPQYQPEDLSTSSSFSFSKELSEARLAFVATAATSVLVLVMLFGAAQISRRRWNR
ncbi:MAG TPA: hypothetical protein VJT31_00165 [Rugosimonospora sp.]|nr:hypothetical protein [Rugosimonospora sp.]